MTDMILLYETTGYANNMIAPNNNLSVPQMVPNFSYPGQQIPLNVPTNSFGQFSNMNYDYFPYQNQGTDSSTIENSSTTSGGSKPQELLPEFSGNLQTTARSRAPSLQPPLEPDSILSSPFAQINEDSEKFLESESDLNVASPSSTNSSRFSHDIVNETIKLTSYNSVHISSLGFNFFQHYDYIQKIKDENNHVQDQQYIGPLSWAGTMKTDPLVSKLYQYGLNNMKKQYHRFQWYNNRDSKLEQTYLTKFKYEHLEPDSNLWGVRSVNQYLIKERQHKNKVNLLEMVQKALIPLHEIPEVLHCFFENIYPYIPILDQDTITTNVSRILQLEQGFDINLIKVESHEDYLYLAILLLMIKFVELFKILTRPNSEKQEFDLELGATQESDAVLISKLCIRQFMANDSVSIALLQLLILIRIYFTYGLHLGDAFDTGLSHVYNSMISSVCKRLGLNHDPDMNPYLGGKERHLFRKLWFTLKQIDDSGFASLSFPILSTTVQTVTIPRASGQNKNVHSEALETLSNEVYPNLLRYGSIITQMSEMMLTVDKSFSLQRLGEFINDYRLLICQDIQQHMSQQPHDLYTWRKFEFWINVTFKQYLSICGVLLSSLMNISSYCSQQKDYKNSSVVNCLISKLIYHKLLPIISFYLNNNNYKNLHGNFTTLPNVAGVLNLIMIFNLSLLIKIRLIVTQLPPQDKHIKHLYFQNLLLFQELIHKGCRLIMRNYMTKIANYYYYGWKMKHTFRYYLEQLEDEENFAEIFQDVQNNLADMKHGQVDSKIFEQYGFKDISSINELEEIISHPIHELIYKSELDINDLNTPNFVRQFNDRLVDLCHDNSLIQDITNGTAQKDGLQPNSDSQNCDMNINFNDIMNPNNLTRLFFQ